MCDSLLCLKAIYMPDNNDAVDFASVILVALGSSLNVVELNHGAISQEDLLYPVPNFVGYKVSLTRPPSPPWDRKYILGTCVLFHKSSAP